MSRPTLAELRSEDMQEWLDEHDQELREQIATEIEAAKAGNVFRNVVLDRAARIARGGDPA